MTNIAGNTIVSTVFLNELGIVAGAADHATWDAALSNGTVTTASFEKTLSTTPAGAAAVNSVYMQLLDRAVDATALVWAEGVISQGLLSTLRQFVSTTPELTSDLNAIGQQVLGRPLSTAEITADERGPMRVALGKAARSMGCARPSLRRPKRRATSTPSFSARRTARPRRISSICMSLNSQRAPP